MPTKLSDGTKQTLVSGYGTGLSNKQKQAASVVLKPLLLAEGTAAPDDATPSVANINVLRIPPNTGTTTITQLDDAIPTQVVTIIITSGTNPSRITDGGNFKLSATFAPNIDDTLTLYTSNGTTWHELSRSAN